ncbi:MAG: hypothetical protein ACKVQS_00845 [Fimbriimonadaceae bacterium]
MSFHRSGRTRRLIVEGSWQSPMRVEYRCTREWPEFPNRYATISEKWPEFIEVRSLGMAVKYSALSNFGSWPANTTCTNTTTDFYPISQTVILGEGLSYELSSSGTASFSYSVADMSVFNLDPAAEFTIWADVEEWFEVINPIADSDADGFPDFGGTAVADSITGRGIRFFERLVVDGEIGVSVGGLVPLSLTQVVTQAISDELGDIDYAIDRRGSIFTENDTADLLIPATIAGLEVSSDYFQSTVNSNFDARSGYELILTKGINESEFSYGFSRAVPETEFRWRGDFGVGTAILTDSYDVIFERRLGGSDVLAVSGSRIDGWSQRAWVGFATLDGTTMPSLSFDDRSKIRHWIDPDSMVINGDEAADWRMQFRGKEWLAFTSSHPAMVLLDDGSSVAGWSGSGVTISAGVSVVVGTDGGSAARTFSPGVVAETYRYLEVEVRSLVGDSVAFGLGVGDKSWVLSTGAAGLWETRRVDLCRPDSVTVDWDEKESRYPLDELGKVVDSVHWGVSLVDSVTFSGLAAGETFEIRAIRLVRDGAAKLSFLPAFRRWDLREVEGSEFVKPLLWSEVDGRISDIYGMSRVGGSSSWQNLTDLSNSLTNFGWDVSLGLAIGDGYHNNLLEAEHIWGGGFRTGASGVFPGCDRDASSDLAVYAQGLWDEVEVYPTCGDVWSEGGSFSVRTDFYSAKVLRAQAWGLALSDTGVRPGEFVQFMADTEVRGSDASDSRGSFLTDLPGGLESPDHAVVVAGGVSPTFEPKTRMRHRRVYREQASAGAVSFDWHLAGVAVRASVDSSSVRLAIKNNSISATYTTRTLGFSAASLSIRWDVGRKLRLVLVTEEGAEIKERFSDDLGATWSMATTLAVGNVRFPGLFIHPDGRRFVYWIEDESVNGLIRDRSGGILESVTGARSPVMEKGLAVGGLDQMAGRVAIELVTVESDSIVSSLSTDGATFS